jgi:phosphate starvation-inducible PhoH-like protein
MSHKPRKERAPKLPTRTEKVGGYVPAALPPLEGLTPRQCDYLVALQSSNQTFAIGPAGTGKTYLPAAWAADRLREKKVRRVILTRPNVPAGPSLGFFPGELEEKMAPWVVPFVETMASRMGRGFLDLCMKDGKIEVVPFETMRGRSFDDAIVIVDEAQNLTPDEMFMVVTRVGERSRLIVTGDLRQTDIKGNSGLAKAIDHIEAGRVKASVIRFTVDDIVRSGICADWVRAWDH